METILIHWTLPPPLKTEPLPSDWAFTLKVTAGNSQAYILKEIPGGRNIEREAALLRCLAANGAPVPVPISTTINKLCAVEGEKRYCLYPMLPGQSFDDHYSGDATGRARLMGAAIASLHQHLRQCDHLGGFRVMNLPEEIEDWALPTILNSRYAVDIHQIQTSWDRFEPDLAAQYSSLSTQIIHRDFHPGNMLFLDGKLSGVIDFDQILRGPRIFDICYCASSMLLYGIEDPHKAVRWPGLFEALVDGYAAASPLTPAERQALPAMLAAIQLLFIAFFMGTETPDWADLNVRMLAWLDEYFRGSQETP